MYRYILIIIIVLLIISSNIMLAQTDFHKKKVAILVYDGVYLLDFCGPLEIFNDAMVNDTTNAFDVYLVGLTTDKIKCHTGTEFLPDYSIDNCPEPDILIIPGGNLNLIKENETIGNWIKSKSERTEITMSVCTGAFILADLGMLDGFEATTWYGATEMLKTKYPKINVVKNKRFTDNGKIITTAGVSAGIDGALYIVERFFGKEIAIKTAKYIEYNYY
jgi:transcriptional regulator GlxA family with amidase domain